MRSSEQACKRSSKRTGDTQLTGCCIPHEERDDAENAVIMTVVTDGAYRDIVDSVGDGPVRYMRDASKSGWTARRKRPCTDAKSHLDNAATTIR